MITRITRANFASYHLLEAYEQKILSRGENWIEEQMLQDRLIYSQKTTTYLTDNPDYPYALIQTTYLHGRYIDYFETLQDLKDHSENESKLVIVKVYVSLDCFRQILLDYLIENPDNSADKNLLILNQIRFKLYPIESWERCTHNP